VDIEQITKSEQVEEKSIDKINDITIPGTLVEINYCNYEFNGGGMPEIMATAGGASEN
jgi:hypothetical protein